MTLPSASSDATPGYPAPDSACSVVTITRSRLELPQRAEHHRDDDGRAVRVRHEAAGPAARAALRARAATVIGVDFGNQQRHQRIHPVVARVADDVPSAGGEGDLRLARDRRVERLRRAATARRPRPSSGETVSAPVSAGRRRRQPPGEIAVALSGRPLAGREPRHAEPRMVRRAARRSAGRRRPWRRGYRRRSRCRHQTANRQYAATASARACSIAASPSSRSATRSRWCSQPVDSRTSVSDSPSFARSSAGIDACVIRAG